MKLNFSLTRAQTFPAFLLSMAAISVVNMYCGYLVIKAPETIVVAALGTDSEPWRVGISNATSPRSATGKLNVEPDLFVTNLDKIETDDPSLLFATNVSSLTVPSDHVDVIYYGVGSTGSAGEGDVQISVTVTGKWQNKIKTDTVKQKVTVVVPAYILGVDGNTNSSSLSSKPTTSKNRALNQGTSPAVNGTLGTTNVLLYTVFSYTAKINVGDQFYKPIIKSYNLSDIYEDVRGLGVPTPGAWIKMNQTLTCGSSESYYFDPLAYMVPDSRGLGPLPKTDPRVLAWPTDFPEPFDLPGSPTPGSVRADAAIYVKIDEFPLRNHFTREGIIKSSPARAYITNTIVP